MSQEVLAFYEAAVLEHRKLKTRDVQIQDDARTVSEYNAILGVPRRPALAPLMVTFSNRLLAF